MPIREIVKKKVEITTSQIEEGQLEEILSVIKSQSRTGNLIISFSYGNKVGMKFERIENKGK